MKIKTLVGLLVIVIASLIGTYASQDAKAQVAAGVHPALKYMSVVHLDDGTGNLVPTIQITGANLRIVNGLGATQSKNSTGNLVVGYNEFGNPNGDDRTGSHNISFGEANSFTSFGGLVGPHDNTISGAFASITGGKSNTASNSGASVSGGWYGTATGPYSSISGGYSNTATTYSASVSGGRNNTARGTHASVSGGYNNTARATHSSVSGG